MKDKAITKKITPKELESLQYEIETYAAYVAVNELKTDFLNTMITIDIARKMYLKLRTKIENSLTLNTNRLSITEAALILKCCSFDNPQRSLYNYNVMTKLKLDLDQKLKSMILT